MGISYRARDRPKEDLSMKRKMLTAIALFGAMLTGGATAADVYATPSGQPIYVNNRQVAMSVYCIGDNNYLRLREVAQAVGFDVSYDAATGQVRVTPGKPYSGEPVQPVPAVTQQAKVSDQPIYIGGARASLTAYQIGGSNYIKLRDIGSSVGFGVDYDEATQAVYIQTNGSDSGNTATEGNAPARSQGAGIQQKDYAAEANPAVFSDSLPRAFYNSLRHAYLNRDAMCAAYDAVNYKVDESLAIKFSSTQNISDMDEVCAGMTGSGYYYDLIGQNTDFTFVYVAARPDGSIDSDSEIQGIIEAAKQMNTDEEKVKYLNDMVCEHLSYSLQNTSWESAWKGKGYAKCQQYAEAFSYLSRKAGLPSFYVSGPNHLWNMVYADGKWGHVDCTANDTGNEISSRSNVLLTETHPSMSLDAPELYEFLKEVYVPGSTK